jgi:mannose-1-phosphate guanylyltransferase
VFGVVPIDEDGAVIAFVEKPPRDEAPTDWINAGMYVLERSVFDLIPAGERVSIERSTFPILVKDGSLFAVQDSSYWLDAGTAATLLQANLDAVDQGADAIDASASIVDSTLEQSLVGARSIVRGSTLRRSLVMNDASIEPGCLIEDSIIGDGATIASGAILRAHTIVGDGAIVGPGTYEGDRLS